MAGAKQVPVLASGLPDPSWRPVFTHVLLDPPPDKTNIDASKDPFVLQVLTPQGVQSAPKGGMPTFLFNGAVLL